MSMIMTKHKSNIFATYVLAALLVLAFLTPGVFAENSEFGTRGATEDTPSYSQYFSWINNTNEGSNEEQTLINLDFFKWLHDEYGMILDIYAFDAGNIDGPRYYGSTKTDKFKKQFPNGFKPIYEKAKAMGTRLGVWLGPDGFGDTPEEEQERIDMLVNFCKDYEFQLFKIDAVCTQLRTEKQDAFARQMIECRKHSPDLICLNHRLNLGDAEKHATTFLWGGAETYIDVHMPNFQTGTHNRVQALTRGLVPDLKRLTEDHGVCISSCVDFWDDDLILQAFNRSLILAPEIYANPWFLRDDEYPKLARIYNLHRRYRDILIDGMVLPEEQYGPHAVSRGDDSRRLITLRNLTWEPVKYRIDLDESIGLKGKGEKSLYQFHPTEKLLGKESLTRTSIEVEVMPFRSCLLFATSEPNPEIVVKGCDYEVVRDTPGKDAIINVMGYPGTEANISLNAAGQSFAQAKLEGKPVNRLAKGKKVKVSFEGEKISKPWHRKLGDLQECDVPADAEKLYEATCFAADSDPLEFRSLRRSGPTNIPQVKKARDAFVDQWMIKERGIDPAYLFDGDPDTHYTFKQSRRNTLERNIRIDFGKPTSIDMLTIIDADGEAGKNDPRNNRYSKPEGPDTYIAEVSADLITWKPAKVTVNNSEAKISIPTDTKIQYLRTNAVPLRAKDIKGYLGGKTLSTDGWRHSYLFDRLANRPIAKAFSVKFELDQYVEGSYICVPLEGKHGVEGAYTAIRSGDNYIGAPERATSYPSNVWEAGVRRRDSNYTYFIPVTKDMIGKPLEVVVLAFDKDNVDFKPSAWITSNPIPMVKKQLILSRNEKAESKSAAEDIKPVRFDPVKKNIEGWTVHVDPQMLKGEHSEMGAKALKMLANHLQRIAILIPEDRLEQMRKLEIWIENHHPTLGNMQYHPGRNWLINNGHDPRLVKMVHIPRAKSLLSRQQMLKHPAVILHELAHAYHDQILGFDDPRIIETYEKAMSKKLYDKVLLYNGEKVRHYGATNHKEYFAEATEVYFYRNDFYPFVAAELKEHDPDLHKLMAEIWEK